MAKYTGSLNTFGFAPFSGRFPKIEMIPSNPATVAQYVLATARVPVTFLSDQDFEVDLSSVYVSPADTYFSMEITWLNGEGVPIGFDQPPWRFYPDGNPGPLMATIDRPLSGTEWWVGSDAGIPPSATAGDFILDPTTGLYDQIQEI